MLKTARPAAGRENAPGAASGTALSGRSGLAGLALFQVVVSGEGDVLPTERGDKGEQLVRGSRHRTGRIARFTPQPPDRPT